jgi:hypothetical protein
MQHPKLAMQRLVMPFAVLACSIVGYRAVAPGAATPSKTEPSPCSKSLGGE